MSEIKKFLDGLPEYIEPIKCGRTFYFDESNNIKKGIIGFDRDNNSDLENLYFVLAGISTKNKIDFDGLLSFIGARQTPVDAKYDFFSFHKKDFKEALKQKRLYKFFEYLKINFVLLHFDVLHLMHFSLVDIFDSLIEEDDINQKVAFLYYRQLQNAMTEVLFENYEKTHEFLCKFSYPNVPKESANDFINELYKIYRANLMHFNSNDSEYFFKELLRQIIKSKKEKKNLCFLENNKSNVIADSFEYHYLMRMIEFDDKKIFDHELIVEKNLGKMDKNYKSILNVSFADSKEIREIQISDAVCGFVSRLFNFLSHNTEYEIKNYIKNLEKESNEIKTLFAFFELMDDSAKISPVMFKKTNPLFIDERFELLCRLVKSKQYLK